MKCTNCGAEISDVFAFCMSCGAAKPMTTPSTSDDSDKTVLINENMNIGNQPPKALRKPLSSGAKKGIIAGVIVAVLAIVFFVVISPTLTPSKFDGEYIYSNSHSYYKLVVDNTCFIFATVCP